MKEVSSPVHIWRRWCPSKHFVRVLMQAHYPTNCSQVSVVKLLKDDIVSVVTAVCSTVPWVAWFFLENSPIFREMCGVWEQRPVEHWFLLWNSLLSSKLQSLVQSCPNLMLLKGCSHLADAECKHSCGPGTNPPWNAAFSFCNSPEPLLCSAQGNRYACVMLGAHGNVREVAQGFK